MVVNLVIGLEILMVNFFCITIFINFMVGVKEVFIEVKRYCTAGRNTFTKIFLDFKIKDVFLNITGGISVDDPALDLAVVAAILSSNEDIAVPKDLCFAAEVGLAGEVRPVTRVEQRIIEAEKLGFSTIIVSKQSKIPKSNYKIQVQKANLINCMVLGLLKHRQLLMQDPIVVLMI